ncbi:ATP-binding protein [Microbulbifer sp. JTAC008]|uniref:ATP-binding protein n=1 Tax=unclassified Microbulbifer TaxID=2619833 RepID=UPI00403A4EA4
MTPLALKNYLSRLLEARLRHAVMIWGKPGIGKSSIVLNLCQERGLDFVDLRLSQLMPSDLRGIPVPGKGATHWFPPSFLPTQGAGVLFMDELNMAPPALQGVAQQLILDRRVGDYQLPEDWVVWAAGNTKSDRAAVYEMPAPLANRFLHLNVAESLDDFKQYAYRQRLSAEIIGFLSFRPDLLHKPHPNEPNWPSPRSWEMAANLHTAGVSVEPAVGAATAMEFDAFVQLKSQLPDIEAIFAGNGPEQLTVEPSVRYATISTLVSRAEQVSHSVNAFKWLIDRVGEEWVHLYASDLFPRLRETGQYQEFARDIIQDDNASRFLRDFVALAS